MPQSGQFSATTGVGAGRSGIFDLRTPTSAEIDMRLGVMMIGPTYTPLALLGQKGKLEYGSPVYGSSEQPIGISFAMIEKLKGPKHTWQEQTLLRNVIPVSAAATAGATALTFSLTQSNGTPDTQNPDAFQVSTYDLLESASGELVWVTAMDYGTGIATVLRAYGASAAGATGFGTDTASGVAATALASGDRLMRVGRFWPEGSEIDFRRDVNVNNRVQDYNFTSIIRTPFYMTRTAKDSLYLAMPEDIRQMETQQEQHVLNLEASLLLSRRYEGPGTGANTGLTIRSGDGILPKMRRDRPGQITDLVASPTALGAAVAGGALSAMTLRNFEQWLGQSAFRAITNKSNYKYLLCSLQGIRALHSWYPIGQWDRVERDAIGTFGQVVTGLQTPYGTLRVVPYQLLTDRVGLVAATAASTHMICLNADCFRTGYMKKTYLQKDIQNPSADGTGWAFLTEMMCEIGGLDTHAILNAASN
jgi:hypothetical protein